MRYLTICNSAVNCIRVHCFLKKIESFLKMGPKEEPKHVAGSNNVNISFNNNHQLSCVRLCIIYIYFIYLYYVNQSHERPEVPTEFQEVKFPRLHDNVPGWC